jgi:hypothetical protein
MKKVCDNAHPYSAIAPLPPSRAEVLSATDIPQRAKDAAHASLWGKKDAAELWAQVTTACRNFGIPVQDILALSNIHGDSLASVVFTSRDDKAFAVIHASLPDGRFLEGRLIRSSKQITYAHDGSEHAIGLRYADDGERYTGEFFRGIPHGQGFLDTYRGVTYAGEFLEGHMTGWGCLKSERHGHRQKEGIFIDGAFKGNPRIIGQENSRIHYFNQCRKLMGRR